MLFDPTPIDYAQSQIVFVHIPKTAGSALIAALEQRFGAEGHLRTRMQKLEKVWDNPASALAWRTDQALRHALVAMTGSHYLIPRDAPKGAIDRAAVISGHFALGEQPPMRRRPVYVSLLRDPVDRFVSHFYFLRDLREREDRPGKRDTQVARRHDLDGYVDLIASGRAIGVRNIQCRYIGGTERFEDARRAIDDKVFLAAPGERIDDFLALLAPAFDIAPVRAARVNVGHKRATVEPPSPATLAKIRDLFADDVALFDYVSRSFDDIHRRYVPLASSNKA